jgi:hypothetical protein
MTMRLLRPIFLLGSLLAVVPCRSAARLTNSPPANGRLSIGWNGRGTLERADRLAGPWSPVAASPNPMQILLTNTTQFLRLNQTVDTTSLRKKVLCGYQGWFRCPGDGGSQWIHWSRSSSTIASNTLTFEMWPDMGEYTHRYRAPGFSHPDGAPAYLFSPRDPQTVERHFDWMLEYGIDGVWLSRFVVGVAGHPTNVLQNVRAAASRTGRTFALMYDMTGQSTNTLLAQMTGDWRWLEDNLQLTKDPRYLHHNGKPVLMVWGFFSERFSTNLAHQIIDFFQTNSTYGATLVGGGEWWWRTDAAPGWAGVFRRFPVYSPWNVGNVSLSGTNKYASIAYWRDDLAAAKAMNMLYLPVIYPGFSWDNLQRLAPGTSKISRLGGDFLWKQFNGARTLGLDSAFVAMFDEVDEGTAIFKATNTPPTQGYFVTYEGKPADWYLRLTAEGTRVLAGERPNTSTIPITP